MHELSLAAEILHLVEQAAARESFSRVACLRLEAGALAGVDVAALRFALEATAGGTCLEGAHIIIETPPGRARCAVCQQEVPLAHRADPCPQCGPGPLKVLSGHRLRVLEMTVVDEPGPGGAG